MAKRVLAVLAVAAVAAAGASVPAGAEEQWPAPGYQSVQPQPGNPLPELVSGYWFRTVEVRALQDDDFENPGFLWVERGAELWNTKAGEAGKSCADCHGAAEESMKGVGASYPKWNAELGKPVNLEMRINLCRERNQKAEPWKWESDELLAMTTYVKYQSRGMPMKIDISGPMQEWWERGKEAYYKRRGQLGMSCAHCHETYWGHKLRADTLSQGHINGFPTYRLKWQKIGSLHRRFRGCEEDIRANSSPYGDDEYLALEVYLSWRGEGLPIETPSVRQ
ncbi:SoxAX cytochrome complex subunit A [bacterium HR39]|nr:SoxAX cytochrome complex subunit A [bacterium HR39]